MPESDPIEIEMLKSRLKVVEELEQELDEEVKRIRRLHEWLEQQIEDAEGKDNG